MTVYLSSWLFISLFAGAACYFIDRHLGAPLRRWLYNMTHEHALPAEKECGFIYNCKAKSRFAAAICLSAFQSVAAVLSGGVNPAVELLSFFLEVPMIMAGFYFGPMLDRFWRDKDRLLDKVDDLEAGKTNLKDELRGASCRAVGKVREALGFEEEESLPEPAPEPQMPEEGAAPAGPVPDPREMMKHYLRRE